MKSFFTNSVIARIATAVLLFVALSNLPIGYYKFLRWVVCLTSVYTAYVAYNKNKEINFGVWLFGLIGILFNPLIPFYFNKYSWKVTDLIVGIIFLASTFMTREKQK